MDIFVLEQLRTLFERGLDPDKRSQLGFTRKAPGFFV